MYQSFPVAEQRAAERYDYFQSVVDEVFCPMEVTVAVGRDPFNASLEGTTLGAVGLACVATTPLTVRRRRRDIARISEAPYLIKFQLEGEALWSQRGLNVHLRPGDFVICSTAEPYWLRFKDRYRMPVLSLSDSTMRRLTGDPDQFLGRRMPGDDPSCALLFNFVADVVSKMATLPPPMAERVETNIMDLLGGVLATHGDQTIPTHGQARLGHIKHYIQQHLRDRRLGPPLIAEAFGVSTRYVHKLFAGESATPSRYIRERRLAACRDMLANPAFREVSITEIALHWGFYDLSHMTRLFRTRYGLAPSAFRHRATREATPEAGVAAVGRLTD